MNFIDILIILIVMGSMFVGIMRGIIREAISVAALVLAIWAALQFGPYAGGWLGGTIGSSEVEMWAGRALVFILILGLGGLAGWGISKMVRLAGLSGTDRTLGAIFGLARAIVLLGLFVLLGRYAAFDGDDWWQDSALIPYGESVADWIEVMAPRGMEMLQPDDIFDEFDLSSPDFL